MSNYIQELRGRAGDMPLILNFSVACIFDDQGRVLLQCRNREGTKWGLPGGLLEYGESYEEAAMREVEEETGLEVRLGKMVGMFDQYFASYPNGDAQTICALFIGTVIRGTLVSDGDETHRLGWFTPGNQGTPKLFNEQHRDMLIAAVKQAELSS